ncbi:MAG: hypothetical protein VW576_04805, partial [Opitutae bacterium]
MSKTFKLCLLYLILITWNKAGHAEGYGTIALYILALVVLSSIVFKREFWTKRKILVCLPIFALILISIASWFNPSYRTISYKDLDDLKFEQVLLDSKDSQKIEM